MPHLNFPEHVVQFVTNSFCELVYVVYIGIITRSFAKCGSIVAFLIVWFPPLVLQTLSNVCNLKGT